MEMENTHESDEETAIHWVGEQFECVRVIGGEVSACSILLTFERFSSRQS